MLESLKIEDFLERVGEEFRLESAAGAIPLTLAEATDLSRPDAPSPRRSPFSLVFRGPLAPVLPQRTYSLEHATLGRLEIFLVPVGPDGTGMRYEAIFN